MEALILSFLLSMPVFHKDLPETKEERKSRLSIVAKVISEKKYSIENIAVILTQGHFESNFAKYVSEGCKNGPYKCDPDKKGNPQARTYWQLWKTSCPKAWSFNHGSKEEIKEAISCAVGLWNYGFKICGSVNGAFAIYAGKKCDYDMTIRVTKYNEILRRLKGK